MTTITIIIGAALLILIIGMAVVGTLLKRKSAAWGEAKGAERQAARGVGAASAPGGLGTTLLLGTDPATATELVGGVVGAKRGVEQVDAQTWTLKATGNDDMRVEVLAVPEGSLVRVARTVEFAGSLLGIKEWTKCREQISAAAAPAGITVVEGLTPLVRTGQTLDISGLADAPIWAPPA